MKKYFSKILQAMIAFTLVGACRAACLAEDAPKPEVSCRAYRAKRPDVPVFREADRASEVLGRLQRSEAVCGLSEMKEFVSIRWKAEGTSAAGEKNSGEKADVPRAFVRVVDLWPPRDENSRKPRDAKEWWRLRQQGVIPDDPFGWLRPFFSQFEPAPPDIPSPPGSQP